MCLRWSLCCYDNNLDFKESVMVDRNLKQKLRETFPFLYRLYCYLRYIRSFYLYKKCLILNQPYFGAYLSARQGNPIRHAYMSQLVKQECVQRGNGSFKVLEIGSWAGGSAITWAQAIKSFHQGNGIVVCVDSWEPYIDLEKERDMHYLRMNMALETGTVFKLFVHNIRTSQNNDIVFAVKAPADRVLPLFLSEKFDLVFVDGDHAYSNVSRDLRNCARLVAEGGILCGDDLELQLPQVDVNYAQQMSEVDYIQDPKTGKWFHPGVAVAVKEMLGTVSVWEGFWAMRRRGNRWESVVMEGQSSRDLTIPTHLVEQK